MNYKVGFWVLLIFICLVMFPGLYFIHTSIDNIQNDLHNLDQKSEVEIIRAYKDAGWLPFDKTKIKENPDGK